MANTYDYDNPWSTEITIGGLKDTTDYSFTSHDADGIPMPGTTITTTDNTAYDNSNYYWIDQEKFYRPQNKKSIYQGPLPDTSATVKETEKLKALFEKQLLETALVGVEKLKEVEIPQVEVVGPRKICLPRAS